MKDVVIRINGKKINLSKIINQLSRIKTNNRWITVNPTGYEGDGKPLWIEDGQSLGEAMEKQWGKKSTSPSAKAVPEKGKQLGPETEPPSFAKGKAEQPQDPENEETKREREARQWRQERRERQNILDELFKTQETKQKQINEELEQAAYKAKTNKQLEDIFSVAGLYASLTKKTIETYTHGKNIPNLEELVAQYFKYQRQYKLAKQELEARQTRKKEKPTRKTKAQREQEKQQTQQNVASNTKESEQIVSKKLAAFSNFANADPELVKGACKSLERINSMFPNIKLNFFGTVDGNNDITHEKLYQTELAHLSPKLAGERLQSYISYYASNQEKYQDLVTHWQNRYDNAETDELKKVNLKRLNGYKKKLEKNIEVTNKLKKAAENIKELSDEQRKKVIQEILKQSKYGYTKHRTNSYAFAYATDYFSTKEHSGAIYLNDARYAKQEDTKSYEADLEARFHPEKTSFDDIVVHEFGHQVDYYYGITDTNHRELDPEVKSIVNEIGNYIRRTKGKRKMIKEGLSDYANKNTAEFFAEAVCEYYCSPTPREIATTIGKMLDQIRKIENNKR